MIEASDNGKIPQYATTKVILNIEDVNDHKPVLEVDFFTTSDSFDKNTGEFVIKNVVLNNIRHCYR